MSHTQIWNSKWLLVPAQRLLEIFSEAASAYRSPKTRKNVGERKPISSLERGIILVSIKKITEEGIDDKDEVASAYSGTAVASFL